MISRVDFGTEDIKTKNFIKYLIKKYYPEMNIKTFVQMAIETYIKNNHADELQYFYSGDFDRDQQKQKEEKENKYPKPLDFKEQAFKNEQEKKTWYKEVWYPVMAAARQEQRKKRDEINKMLWDSLKLNKD